MKKKSQFHVLQEYVISWIIFWFSSCLVVNMILENNATFTQMSFSIPTPQLFNSEGLYGSYITVVLTKWQPTIQRYNNNSKKVWCRNVNGHCVFFWWILTWSQACLDSFLSQISAQINFFYDWWIILVDFSNSTFSACSFLDGSICSFLLPSVVVNEELVDHWVDREPFFICQFILNCWKWH